MNQIGRTFILLGAVIVLLFSFAPRVQATLEEERTDGKCYTLVDSKERVIHVTGSMVYVGDEFIARDNKRYVVEKISGDTCYCRLLGIENMNMVDEANINYYVNPFGLTPVISLNRGKVAIYHTHNDESYIPSDGTESKSGKGGVVQVGDALTRYLKKLGIDVVHDLTPHEPHDANAYNRSRRTASKLMREGALALIDVHRDATPPDVYAAKVKGKQVTRIKLVVGRQNSHMSSNLAFAKKIKAYLDEKEPGLMEGIYIGKGNYNQDLTPRSLLIEVGAHTNYKSQAERGVQLFAQAIPAVLNTDTGTESKAKSVATENKNTGRSDWLSIILIILGLTVAYGIYVYLSRGKLKR